MNMSFVENILFKYVPKLKCNIHSQYVIETKCYLQRLLQRYTLTPYVLLFYLLFLGYDENGSLSR